MRCRALIKIFPRGNKIIKCPLRVNGYKLYCIFHKNYVKKNIDKNPKYILDAFDNVLDIDSVSKIINNYHDRFNINLEFYNQYKNILTYDTQYELFLKNFKQLELYNNLELVDNVIFNKKIESQLSDTINCDKLLNFKEKKKYFYTEILFNNNFNNDIFIPFLESIHEYINWGIFSKEKINNFPKKFIEFMSKKQEYGFIFKKIIVF